MRRFSKLCSLVLIMCMLSNYTIFAYTGDKNETDPVTTEEATVEDAEEAAETVFEFSVTTELISGTDYRIVVTTGGA